MADLLRACTTKGDPRAWEEFVRRFQPLIATSVLRAVRLYTTANRALVDDLVQETYVRLCAGQNRALREFDPAHQDAFHGLIKTIAFTTVHDHFRQHLARKRGGANVVPLENDGVAIGGAAPDIEKRLLLSEIDDLLKGPEPAVNRDRSIFWLYYRQGMSARAIASIPSIELSQKGVESAIHRLTQLVKRHFEKK